MGQHAEDESFGRRAIDKLMARLASRTTADIDQAGATPAIVILGDNNVVCLGDAFVEMLQRRLDAKDQNAPKEE